MDEPSLDLWIHKKFSSVGNTPHPVFRSFRKFLMNPNLCAIISPTGEKCGLKC